MSCWAAARDEDRARALRLVEVARGVERVAGVVEQVELELGAHRHAVDDLGGVGHQRLERVARVAGPGRAVGGVDGADDAGDAVAEVDERVGVGPQQHVGLEVTGAALQRRAVEHRAALERPRTCARRQGSARELLVPNTSTKLSRTHSTASRSSDAPFTRRTPP